MWKAWPTKRIHNRMLFALFSCFSCFSWTNAFEVLKSRSGDSSMQQRDYQAAAALVVACSTLLLAACSPSRDNVWQGYVEGEYVSVSSAQSGRLDRLSVVRGQQIAIGAALFELESGDETAAREQAQRQLQTAQA